MRIVAGVIAGVGVLYGLTYTLGAVLPRGFGLIRGGNIALAGLAAGIAALLLTPLASPYSLSVPDRVARAEAAESPEKLRVELASLRLLGAPGQTAFEAAAPRLRDGADAARLAVVDEISSTTDRWQLRQILYHDQDSLSPTLDGLVAQGLEVLPSVDALTPGLRTAIMEYRWLEDGWVGIADCVERTAADDTVACVLISAGQIWGTTEAWVFVHGARPANTQDGAAPPLHLLFEQSSLDNSSGSTPSRWSSAALLDRFGAPGQPTLAEWLARVRTEGLGIRTATVTVPAVGGVPILPRSDAFALDVSGAIEAGLAPEGTE
jgi:hypothetical protein